MVKKKKNFFLNHDNTTVKPMFVILADFSICNRNAMLVFGKVEPYFQRKKCNPIKPAIMDVPVSVTMEHP